MRMQKLRSSGCVRRESATRPSGLLGPSRAGAQERAMRRGDGRGFGREGLFGISV